MSIHIPARDSLHRASDPAGQIHYPGDPRWDEVRAAWNLAVDQHPSAVAVPRNAEQVASVIQAAARSGLRVTAQGTGHSAAPHESLKGAGRGRGRPWAGGSGGILC